MLLPQIWLRRSRLRRALRDYPLYDPPHKVEERLLSKEKAAENFDYFMRVRHQRLVYFRNWLHRYFGVALMPDKAGVKALNRWGNKYAGLLLTAGPNGGPSDSYFTYDPPWTEENAGCNVVFDMGIALGEFVIVNCPKLHWALDPLSSVLPRQAKFLKRDQGSSYQRPRLTGSDNPVWSESPLHQVFTFAGEITRCTLTIEDRIKFYNRSKRSRATVTNYLSTLFDSIISNYPGFDPNSLRKAMSPEEYINLSDSQE
jgi:hypothetical protein